MELFSALGIDLQSLIIQVVAFVILVFLVAKLVVPVLLKSVDARQEAIEASLKAASDAARLVDEAGQDAADKLKVAHDEAADILRTAKEEAQATVDDATGKATAQSDLILKNARAEIERTVMNARRDLRNETVELVALATENIARVRLDADRDADLIQASLSAEGAGKRQGAA